MIQSNNVQNESTIKEYDFALIAQGVDDLTEQVSNALFEAGCDDSTPSLQQGLLYVEFSRKAVSLEQAIISAIDDIYKANIGAVVLRVDNCDLVTASQIAQRINRSRQLVHLYIKGQRGIGDFPPPTFYITKDRPLWSWKDVSRWFASNGLLDEHINLEAETVSTINSALEIHLQKLEHPHLVDNINKHLAKYSLA